VTCLRRRLCPAATAWPAPHGTLAGASSCAGGRPLARVSRANYQLGRATSAADCQIAVAFAGPEPPATLVRQGPPVAGCEGVTEGVEREKGEQDGVSAAPFPALDSPPNPRPLWRCSPPSVPTMDDHQCQRDYGGLQRSKSGHTYPVRRVRAVSDSGRGVDRVYTDCERSQKALIHIPITPIRLLPSGPVGCGNPANAEDQRPYAQQNDDDGQPRAHGHRSQTTSHLRVARGSKEPARLPRGAFYECSRGRHERVNDEHMMDTS
jgi:hypothetical protein